MMQSVIAFAAKGGQVLGVCNGFQILCESHLLPGVLLRNANRQFISKNIYMRGTGDQGKALMMPIAHGEGRYFADEHTLDELEANHQVIYRYCDADGQLNAAGNVNGSLRNIAGICNEGRNVFGMMPHPERACSAALGNTDGQAVLKALLIEAKAINAAGTPSLAFS
jgi:phosphoribosylformylglycinamidine synthase